MCITPHIQVHVSVNGLCIYFFGLWWKKQITMYINIVYDIDLHNKISW